MPVPTVTAGWFGSSLEAPAPEGEALGLAGAAPGAVGAAAFRNASLTAGVSLASAGETTPRHAAALDRPIPNAKQNEERFMTNSNSSGTVREG